MGIAYVSEGQAYACLILDQSVTANITLTMLERLAQRIRPDRGARAANPRCAMGR